MKELLARVEARLTSRVLQSLLLVALSAYVALYLMHEHVPRQSGMGWWAWHDQLRYVLSARALAAFDFSRDLHWYPLGYPALGGLFARWLPTHPFLVPNMACFIGIVVLLFRLFRCALSRLESLLLVVFVLAQPLLLDSLIVPWTTIPGRLCQLAVIVLLIAREPQRRDFVWAALWAGAAAAVRPGELVVLLPLFAAALLARPLSRERVRSGATAVAIVLACLGAIMLANKLVFDRFWSTPRAIASSFARRYPWRRGRAR